MNLTRLPSLRWALIFLATVLSACGDQPFVVGTVEENLEAPGTYSIPAKVDIVFVQDNTASMFEALSGIESQFPSFVATLKNSGWDYRFGVIPLTHPEDGEVTVFSQATASEYDANWDLFGLWRPPFPGANPTSVDSLSSDLFRLPDSFTGFLGEEDIYVFNNSHENGFKTIDRTIQEELIPKGFLRDDALLAVIVVGNGNDTSDVHLCQTAGNNSVFIPCGEPGTHPDELYLDNRAETFTDYRDRFQSLVTDQQTAQLQWYSIVSEQDEYGCVGADDHAYPGYRYQAMAGEFGGLSFNICDRPITDPLNQLQSHLQTTKGNFVAKYLTLGFEPDPDTIRVYKIPGDQPGVQNEITDITYLGGPMSICTIIEPVPMNCESNVWVIEINQEADYFTGNDIPVITAEPAGGNDSNGT